MDDRGSPPDRFREVKLLFGALDDLGQERRRAYTAWVTGKLETEAFAATMQENLRRTRETAETLERLIARRG